MLSAQIWRAAPASWKHCCSRLRQWNTAIHSNNKLDQIRLALHCTVTAVYFYSPVYSALFDFSLFLASYFIHCVSVLLYCHIFHSYLSLLYLPDSSLYILTVTSSLSKTDCGVKRWWWLVTQNRYFNHPCFASPLIYSVHSFYFNDYCMHLHFKYMLVFPAKY